MQMEMQQGLNALNMVELQLQPMKCVSDQMESVQRACSLQAGSTKHHIGVERALFLYVAHD